MPWVFGYGSLVDRDSIQTSLGRAVSAEHGPYPARLPGYRRRWNLAAHSSRRPEFVLHREDGTVWAGDVVFLGIDESEHDSVLGAVYWLTDDDLVILDHRELAYNRCERTVTLQSPIDGSTELAAEVYIPKPDASAHAARVGSSGVIMARYLRLVDKAFRSLGDELYAEHAATMPAVHPFVVQEIERRLVDSPPRSAATTDGA